jgi:hypothetical protein
MKFAATRASESIAECGRLARYGVPDNGAILADRSTHFIEVIHLGDGGDLSIEWTANTVMLFSHGRHSVHSGVGIMYEADMRSFAE